MGDGVLYPIGLGIVRMGWAGQRTVSAQCLQVIAGVEQKWDKAVADQVKGKLERLGWLAA